LLSECRLCDKVRTMLKRISLLLIILFLKANLLLASDEQAGPGVSLLKPFQKEDRVFILAPHPDDEAIACAGIIQQALKAGAKVKVVYLTNGDHNQFAFIVYEKRITLRKGEFIHMGEVRRQEAIKAMGTLGLTEGDLVFLGYPDFGTFTIFNRHWEESRPFKSFLTRISAVPYKENISFGSPYKGESILRDLEGVLLGFKPNEIFVSHPADVNADHKALYLFLQVALRDLSGSLPALQVHPYLVHCAGWPLPRHYHPELALTPPGQFLADTQINWSENELTSVELAKKRQAILCYKSQTQSSAFYLLSFARKNELFGDYPLFSLERQASLKEKTVSFSGFSDMFKDSEIDMLGLENLMKEDGQVSYAVVDNALLIRLEKKRTLSRSFSVIFYLFGYSQKTPFSKMPKLRIYTRNTKFRVFDGEKRIKTEEIVLNIHSNILFLKIPLQLLGDPEFILSAIKAHAGILPITATGFRRIEIR